MPITEDYHNYQINENTAKEGNLMSKKRAPIGRPKGDFGGEVT
jgi:hypothetical protein